MRVWLLLGTHAAINLGVPFTTQKLYGGGHLFHKLSLQEGASPAEAAAGRQPKYPRPTLRPHTAPAVVIARESVASKKTAKQTDFGESLIEDFSLGKSSASKVFGRKIIVVFVSAFWVFFGSWLCWKFSIYL